ncbi:MAG TPA: TonB-dependent receptor [bacterium]|nr:TonB-dependent receptor [bacterium]
MMLIKLNKKALFIALMLCFTASAYSVIEILVTGEREDEVYDYYAASERAGPGIKTPADILNSIPRLNITAKSFSAVQAHASFGAGEFEHTAVLLDGIRINDPQTGHYNFDIPITALEIGGIGVIKSGGAYYGLPGGIAGAINIERKKHAKDSVTLAGSYGSYSTYYSGLSIAKKSGEATAVISGEKSGSAGYHKETDFSKETLYASFDYSGRYVLSAGFDEKNFGAFDFYTPGRGLPSREHIITKRLDASVEIMKGVKAAGHYRHHYDRFILDNDNPSYFFNVHNNSVYGGGLSADFGKREAAEIKAGYDFYREELQSLRLGNRYRNRHEVSVFAVTEALKKTVVSAGLRVEKYEGKKEAAVMPAVGLEYYMTDNLTAEASYAAAARHPNFTELYYTDPYNISNPGLGPESSENYALGIKTGAEAYAAGISGYFRRGYNLIEWGKTGVSDEKWMINNIGRTDTMGITVEAGIDTGIVLFKSFYEYSDSFRTREYISKYGLNYLKNRLNVSAEFEAVSIKIIAGYTHKNYSGRSGSLNDISASAVKRLNNGIDVYLKAENILNDMFEETPGIPEMGRYLEAGIRAEI